MKNELHEQRFCCPSLACNENMKGVLQLRSFDSNSYPPGVNQILESFALTLCMPWKQ